MKIINKLSLFTGSLAIAFIIAMVIPTQSEAAPWSSWWSSSYSNGSTCTGKSSHGSKNKWKRHKKQSKHKKHRKDKKHLCKGKGSHGSHGSWGKGSHGSHGSWGKGSHGSHGSWCQPKKGKVTGIIFEDSNDNGRFDRRVDQRLANVTVIVTDSAGNTITATTNNKGFYCATGVRVGNASVKVDENTLPAGAQHVIGKDPSNVRVKANCKNWAGRDGYILPTPVGDIHGTVYEDSNDDGQKNSGEKGTSGIKITIVDAENNTFTIYTDANGDYSQSGLVVGSAIVTIDETTLPTGGALTAGLNPSPVTVVSGQNKDAGDDGYILPTPVGDIHGTVYEDSNDDGQKNNGEKGTSGIKVSILDFEGNPFTTYTDANGDYSQSGLVVGTATVTIDETTLPTGGALTAGLNPSPVTVVSGQNKDAGDDGYILPTPVGDIHGTVYEDSNDNGQKDSGEKGTSGIKVTIIDFEGNPFTTYTDANGDYSQSGLAEGVAIVTVDTTTIPTDTELRVGLNPSPVPVIAGENVDAGNDGYVSTIGAIQFYIFFDANNNGQLDTEDTGIPLAKVTILDANNETHNVISNASGLVSIVLPLGTTNIEVDDSSSVLLGFQRTVGENTVTMENLLGVTDAQNHGFIELGVHP